jgi:hypothetical protein
MSLPERPALLHALPVVNLFALLWMFHFAGASLTAKSGARIYLGRELVDMATLESRLESLREQGAASRTIVLLQCDADAQVGAEREVGELILGKGFRLALTGSNGANAESQKEISK